MTRNQGPQLSVLEMMIHFVLHGKNEIPTGLGHFYRHKVQLYIPVYLCNPCRYPRARWNTLIWSRS